MGHRPAWRAIVMPLAAVFSLLGCSRQVSFEGDVRPILDNRCVKCHQPGGEGYLKSGLDLENYKGLMKGTKFGPVVVPGSSINSTLVNLIEHKASSAINMPHNEAPLPEEQVELIKRWVDQGAKNN